MIIYFYKITDLKTKKVYHQQSELDEFESYRDFIATLELLNELHCGELKYEESRERFLTIVPAVQKDTINV